MKNLATKEKQEIEFTRIASDTNGNPRYVCHFLSLINEGDHIKAGEGIDHIGNLYLIAQNKAHSIGGRKFHNKQYGGGIVFQSYNINDTAEAIRNVKEVNTELLNEWTTAQFKQAEKTILKHFKSYQYKYIDDRTKPAKNLVIYSYKQLADMLGLAYTSSGSYAAYWVCNAIEVMANKTHHFIGFAINTDGKVIGIVEDVNEKPIYIEL